MRFEERSLNYYHRLKRDVKRNNQDFNKFILDILSLERCKIFNHRQSPALVAVMV